MKNVGSSLIFHRPHLQRMMVQCHVVLPGVVGTESEAAEAVAHARGVEGVSGVVSYLKAMR
jgi:hypothetical protein